MASAEFDAVAERYLELHRDNLKISGEEPDYFARYKIEEVRRLWTRRRFAEPKRILDFGCGVGASLPHLAAAFPAATLVGTDVSEASLAIARRRAPSAELIAYDGHELAKTVPGPFDLIFSACVFHHIPPGEHVAAFRQLRTVLAPSGALLVFEHNPLNPVTRYIVATCPFDENAVLANARRLAARQAAAGFLKPEIRFTGFFPAFLSGLRPLEAWMAALPLGAQYYTLARSAA